MGSIDSDTLYGTLRLLVLQTLADGPRHGLAISRSIEEASGEILSIGEGALYPALHRMERDGLLEGRWGLSENNRRAKFYELTEKGRRAHAREVKRWKSHTRAVAAVLELRPGWAE